MGFRYSVFFYNYFHGFRLLEISKKILWLMPKFKTQPSEAPEVAAEIGVSRTITIGKSAKSNRTSATEPFWATYGAIPGTLQFDSDNSDDCRESAANDT